MKILIVSNTTKENFRHVEGMLKDHNISFTSREKYEERVKDAEYIIAGREKYTPDIIDKAKNLKVISRCGHGTDNIDKKYCEGKGIKVLDARGALDDTMADVTIGYMIMALRHLHRIDKGTKATGWKPIKGNDLSGKTVGIIGLGGIGDEVAHRLESFKTTTYFFDTDTKKQYNRPYARFLELNNLLERCDIITLHCDMNSTSYKIINKDTIERMKQKPLLINTARGKLVDIEDLVIGLYTNKLSKVVLDVYPEEPLSRNSPLYKVINNMNNIILGSHSTCYSIEGQKKLAQKAVKNLLSEINE